MSEKSGFEELMSQGTAIVTHPITPWLALGVIALFWILSQVESKIPEDPIERLKRTFGADQIPHGIALIGALLWGALVLLITFGLMTLLYDIVWNTVQPIEREPKADFRFLLTKTAALTAVLGAMIALPFTALRLKHTAAQTRHAEDVLFNEKLSDANTDLHARYQTSEKQENDYIDIWKDDIIRRNGAIDRLEALAIERPTMASRIARILCVYLKEISREYPSEPMPAPTTRLETFRWVANLKVKRSDMEAAAQALGRLQDKTGIETSELAIDLTGVNLQAMQLSNLKFNNALMTNVALDGAKLNGMQLNEAQLSNSKLNGVTLTDTSLVGARLSRASLVGARITGVDLSEARLSSVQLTEAHLIRVELNGTRLSHANLRGTNFNNVQFDASTVFTRVKIQGAAFRRTDLTNILNLKDIIPFTFGDTTAILPDDLSDLVKEKWPNYNLDAADFQTEWRRFKQDPDAYVPPQLRKD